MDENPARIVVAVDGSDSSIAALRRGARIAGALQLPIEAITTWEYPVSFPGYYPTVEWSPEDDAQKISAAALIEAFGDAPPTALTSRIIQGSASRVLIDESEGAFLLIVGSRGLGGFAGLLLGSVSTACAQHARCPVLIMREADA
jgi:nucleotide-binding universal stress UspA family protein